MKHFYTHHVLRDLLLAQKGLHELPACHGYTVAQLEKASWSGRFEQLMRNRLMMGCLRYGLNFQPHKPQYDRIAAAEKRLRLYRTTGNLEHLVDVANLMVLEFVEGKHPKAHFSSTDEHNHRVTK